MSNKSLVPVNKIVSLPRVSIACITYNQAAYIRQTLDSFLMQKTDFTFEILINDDASTDGTVDIIKEYQKKYPEIIKPVFHKNNLFSQGKRGMFTRFLLPIAKGEYIALCEGDDFWTDENKLQSQVKFLDENKDYALCFHSVKVFYEDSSKKEVIYPEGISPNNFNLKTLLRTNFIQTNSVVYRKQDYTNVVYNVTPGDWYLHLYHAQFGKIGFIDKVMSAYRRHEGGIWWSDEDDRHEFWIKHGVNHVAMYEAVYDMFISNPDYAKIIEENEGSLLLDLSNIDLKYGSKLLQDVGNNYPKVLARVLKRNNTDYVDLEARFKLYTKNVDETIEEKDNELQFRQNEINSLRQELDVIRNSKTWRIHNKASKILGRSPKD